MYDIYESYAKQYIREFGGQTVVLFQCGSFFEIYSIDDGLVDIKTICDLLNIQSTKKNKSITEVSRENCLMAGFPIHALQKFVAILVKANFTVVIVEQVTPPPKPKRKVTNIVSPGMDLSYGSQLDSDSQNIVCIYTEKLNNTGYLVGCAVLDVSTGSSKVYELPSSTKDPSLALDECYRIICLETPRKVVLIGDEFETDGVLPFSVPVLKKWSDYNQEIKRIAYQTQLLERIFPNTGLLSAIEYLNLERLPFATIAYIALIQYAFQHNDLILEKISKPEVIEPSTELILGLNAAKHLDVIGSSSGATLLSILNRCVTPMGKRLFREWLLHPLTSPAQIQQRLQSTTKMTPFFSAIRPHLQKVYDLDRLRRKIVLKSMQPAELAHLTGSIAAAIQICQSLGITPSTNTTDLEQFLYDSIDVSLASKYNIDTLTENIFKDAPDSLRTLVTRVAELEGIFQHITSDLNKLVGVDNAFKLECGVAEGYSISITSKRFTDYRLQYKGYTKQTPFGDFNINNVTTKSPPKTASVKLVDHVLVDLNTALEEAKTQLTIELRQAWMDFLAKLQEYDFTQLSRWLAETDVYCCNAKNATEYGYCCPNILDGGNTSFINATNLRHPIIERINEHSAYTPNDVQIGASAQQGMLLYGTNMVGKSAYMKSIGLAVLMAQAGMYVAAENLTLAPYSHIFTRIPSGDDITRGLSTFAVEITELRNILRRAGARSLVIGDEVASGTESVSAVAIVAAGITELCEASASFVFATHLHDLPKLAGIKALQPRLGVYHMEVTYDPITKKLVFSRELKPGQGSALYGLEVCKALDLSDNFLRLSNMFRQELLGISSEIVRPRRSRYNKNHYVDVCELCKQPATEVHHRIPQQKADANGLIAKRFHKNAKHNLMNVCEACHDKLHSVK